MTRGRHRQHLAPTKAVPAITVGALATAGIVLAVVNGDMQVLRLAVVASWLIALSMVGITVRRGRAYARDLALTESAHRREESMFTEQLTMLQASMGGLQEQLERLSVESGALRREVLDLRADKAEADEIVRRARAERARAQVAEREAADQRLLTAAAFEAAAAVLESFGGAPVGGDEEPDWVTSWVASLGADTELDLTMHDDTIPIDLDAAVVVDGAAGELPVAVALSKTA